jgi:20S proteasome alpha/beta subunit
MTPKIPRFPYPRPLKQRYPWGLPKEKRMTIAAGFLCSEGVLLCADTELSGWAMTLHESKLDEFKYGTQRIAFAYAGHSAFAVSALQRCKRHLEAISPSPGETLSVIEQFLSREYRRSVLSNPDRNNKDLHYWLLLCISSLDGGAKLYATEQTSLIHVPGSYHCIGIGEALAHYLCRATLVSTPTIDQALSGAAYILGAVKDYSPGCGGYSQFLLVKNDGTVKRFLSSKNVPSNNLERIESYSVGFDHRARQLLFSMADLDLSDEAFKYRLKGFSRLLLATRKEWKKNATPID